MTIVVGHTLDQVVHCLGSLTEVSSKLAVQVPRWHLVDTNESIDVDSPDNILVNGVLVGGGLLSYHAASVPNNATGWRVEVYGTRGTLIASTPVMPQITPITLIGSQGDAPLAEMIAPEHLRIVPPTVPDGPSQNVGGSYICMAEAIQAGTSYHPSFDDAVDAHRLLDAIQRSSDEGRNISLNTNDGHTSHHPGGVSIGDSTMYS
jgi:predicted dehydrogenase